METRTTLTPTSGLLDISYNDSVFCIGSCFAKSIGDKLSHNKFDTAVNPFGILFNPLSIHRSLELCIANPEHVTERLISHNEQVLSYDYHSDIRTQSSDTYIHQIRTLRQASNIKLKRASRIIITLGTSYYYELIEDRIPVANCHKQPAAYFEKKLLSPTEVLGALESICELINTHCNNAQIIWTISPVRHIKDSLINNNRSKANLLSAIHEIVDKFSNSHYFPSYELLMDDLRDYRYYADDMIHPSTMAVSYIWDFFKTSYMSASTLSLTQKISKLRKSLSHKPFNPNSDGHLKFQEKLLNEMQLMEREYDLDYSQERSLLTQV